MLKLGTFKLDCTPPEGYPIGMGVDETRATIRDPLYMRGFVWDDGETRCLVASLDYTGLVNSAYEALVGALAQGAGLAPENAVVHCVHQHDAPLPIFEIEPYLGCETYPRDWWEGLCARCADVAARAVGDMRGVAAVGRRETRLYGYASNRRILGPDGRVRGMRFSRCADPDLVAEPVGVIDPMLRTLAFCDETGALLGSMSFYATHPQVANGRGMYSADAPGEALRLVELAQPAGLHAYFSGAFGNITAGKYSSTTDLEGNIRCFGRRLADGILSNLGSIDWQENPELEWRSAAFPFPRIELDRERVMAEIHDAHTSQGQRRVRAAVQSCYDYAPNERYPLKLLRVGGQRVLLLAGEPFVEYQLYAQSLIPDQFLAVAGNCNDAFFYLPMAEHIPQGGYEVTSFRWCTAAFEGRFKEAAARLIHSE